ncbi:MAG: hypothetical protein P8177_09095 [Gemmatimonadota bacterium]
MNGRMVGLLAVLSIVPAGGVPGQAVPLGTPVPQRPLGTSVEDATEPQAFLSHQLTYGRVVDARAASDGRLRSLFRKRGVEYPAKEIYMRVFKHERVLELWARSSGTGPFALIKEYPVCALPGQLGPKHRMGDFQVPEGFYYIDEFNPRSAYELSLRISYPNLADRMRREAVSLGGDIYVHGGCETVGCIPIEDANIQEVYWLATQAMGAGQPVIPIHIFPSRMDDRTLRWLERTFEPEPRLRDFWLNLAEGYAFFEETRRVPWITVSAEGRYSVPPRPGVAAEAEAVGAAVADEGAPDPDGLRRLPDPVVVRADTLRVDEVAPVMPLLDGPVVDTAVPVRAAGTGSGSSAGGGGP